MNGDLVHDRNEIHKNVEAHAEHIFDLWSSLERIVHMSHELISIVHYDKSRLPRPFHPDIIMNNFLKEVFLHMTNKKADAIDKQYDEWEKN